MGCKRTLERLVITIVKYEQHGTVEKYFDKGRIGIKKHLPTYLKNVQEKLVIA
jgi:hypothetical protein